MRKALLTYDSIVKKIRNKMFGLLDTISPEEEIQTSGVLYGTSPPESKFRIYILTNLKDVKFRNIKRNPQTSFLIPLCHHFFCFLPFSSIYFESKAEIISYNDSKAQKVFTKKRKLRTVLKDAMNSFEKTDLMFIRLKPSKRALLYRPSHNIRSILWNNERVYDVIKIPTNEY